LVKVLDAREASSKEIAAQLRRPGGFLSEKVRDAARRIVADIRDRRDEALLEYTERFDGVRPDPVRVPPEEIREARNALDEGVEEAFYVAIENVRFFHKRELDRPFETSRKGATAGQRVRPIRRVGVYVPGGHGAYPSTLTMAAVPAQVAGVGEIAVCAPPRPDGRVSPLVLAVADLLGPMRSTG
jgi:histidinol dehydrogenase